MIAKKNIGLLLFNVLLLFICLFNSLYAAGEGKEESNKEKQNTAEKSKRTESGRSDEFPRFDIALPATPTADSVEMFRRFLDEYKEPEKEGSNTPETPQSRLQQQISSPKWSFHASTPSDSGLGQRRQWPAISPIKSADLFKRLREEMPDTPQSKLRLRPESPGSRLSSPATAGSTRFPSSSIDLAFRLGSQQNLQQPPSFVSDSTVAAELSKLPTSVELAARMKKPKEGAEKAITPLVMPEAPSSSPLRAFPPIKPSFPAITSAASFPTIAPSQPATTSMARADHDQQLIPKDDIYEYFEILTKDDGSVVFFPWMDVAAAIDGGQKIYHLRWIRKQSNPKVASVDIWLIPALLDNNQWVLAVLDMRAERLYLMDSVNPSIMTPQKKQLIEKIMKIFGDLYLMRTLSFGHENIEVIYVLNVEPSIRLINSGIFVLLVGTEIYARRSGDFTNIDFNELRVKNIESKIKYRNKNLLESLKPILRNYRKLPPIPKFSLIEKTDSKKVPSSTAGQFPEIPKMAGESYKKTEKLSTSAAELMKNVSKYSKTTLVNDKSSKKDKIKAELTKISIPPLVLPPITSEKQPDFPIIPSKDDSKRKEDFPQFPSPTSKFPQLPTSEMLSKKIEESGEFPKLPSTPKAVPRLPSSPSWQLSPIQSLSSSMLSIKAKQIIPDTPQSKFKQPSETPRTPFSMPKIDFSQIQIPSTSHSNIQQIAQQNVLSPIDSVRMLRSLLEEAEQRRHQEQPIIDIGDSSSESSLPAAVERAHRQSETERYQTELADDVLDTLRDTSQWVSNLVIDSYLDMLTRDRPQFGHVPSYVINHFRRGEITPDWYQRTGADVIRPIRHWLIPAHLDGNHWVLAVFDVENNSLAMFDSLHATCGVKTEAKRQFEEAILRFFRILYAFNNVPAPEFRQDVTTWYEWPDTPSQHNFIDCGVYLMRFARNIVLRQSLDQGLRVEQAQIDQYRMDMFLELSAHRMGASFDQIRQRGITSSRQHFPAIGSSAQPSASAPFPPVEKSLAKETKETMFPPISTAVPGSGDGDSLFRTMLKNVPSSKLKLAMEKIQKTKKYEFSKPIGSSTPAFPPIESVPPPRPFSRFRPTAPTSTPQMTFPAIPKGQETAPGSTLPKLPTSLPIPPKKKKESTSALPDSKKISEKYKKK